MNWNYEANKIYGLDEKGELIAEADFVSKQDQVIDITHVFVDPKYRGKGVANETMLCMANYLRENGLKALASCSYANGWFNKHEEEYQDIISPELKNQSAACRLDGKH